MECWGDVGDSFTPRPCGRILTPGDRGGIAAVPAVATSFLERGCSGALPTAFSRSSPESQLFRSLLAADMRPKGMFRRDAMTTRTAFELKAGLSSGRSLQNPCAIGTQLSRLSSDVRTSYCFGQTLLGNGLRRVNHPLPTVCCPLRHIVCSSQTRVCRSTMPRPRDPFCCALKPEETGEQQLPRVACVWGEMRGLSIPHRMRCENTGKYLFTTRCTAVRAEETVTRWLGPQPPRSVHDHATAACRPPPDPCRYFTTIV